ncbi:MAG: O-methyltransferase [Bacilli bacterium]|jgi:predicted O-methyltransferase YrrM|nr:O-methyltransferase [Bacilli bacterium]
MNDYFAKLNKASSSKLVIKMKQYAMIQKVPIMQDEGLLYLKQLIHFTEATRILEIGTAIGYSSIQIAEMDSSIHVDTIEREENIYHVALENVKQAKCESQIRIFVADALEIDLNLLEKQYDLIFIDAAKAQYIKFFERFEGLLRPHGLIVSDNLLFHGLVTTTEKIESRNLRALISKIKEYNEWLSKNKKYQTTFLSIGDGIAVSEKC